MGQSLNICARGELCFVCVLSSFAGVFWAVFKVRGHFQFVGRCVVTKIRCGNLAYCCRPVWAHARNLLVALARHATRCRHNRKLSCVCTPFSSVALTSLLHPWYDCANRLFHLHAPTSMLLSQNHKQFGTQRASGDVMCNPFCLPETVVGV